jgi:hypothetical protein
VKQSLKMLRVNSLKGMNFDSIGSRPDSVRGPNSSAPTNDEPFVNGAGVSFVRTRLILSFGEANTKAVDKLLSDDMVIDELSKFFSVDGPKRLLFFHQARTPSATHAPRHDLTRTMDGDFSCIHSPAHPHCNSEHQPPAFTFLG